MATAFATALTFTSPAAAQTVELSFASYLPHNHETSTGMFAWFEKEVAERSGGTLSLKLYPAGQLGAGGAQQYKAGGRRCRRYRYWERRVDPDPVPENPARLAAGQVR